MRYEDGDIAVVRHDLAINTRYYHDDRSAQDVATQEMTKLRGKTVTIRKTNASRKYKVKEDKGDYWWVDEMFENYTLFSDDDMPSPDEFL